MLGENIKKLRKEKGFTQEELAARVHVVRQTVSKWEKELSVPDAQMLKRIAEVLETEVSTLLGSEIHSEKENNEIAEQLARINEQLIVKNRRAHRIWKLVGLSVVVIVVFQIMMILVGMVSYEQLKISDSETAVVEEIMEITE